MSWVAIAAAYVIGGLPFSYWLVLWRCRADLRRLGSGNLGATNALRVAGVRIGLLTLILDVLKGYVAVELARSLGVSQFVLGAVALSAVVGHAFPVWLRFRGGKGVATAAGALLNVAPLALSIAALAFVAVLGISRIVSLSSIAAAMTAPVAQFALVASSPLVANGEAVIPWIFLISLLVVARHHANLGRLRSGQEARLGERKEGE